MAGLLSTKDVWCNVCETMIEQIRFSDSWFCPKCCTHNDGSHPAETSLPVRIQQIENAAEHRKNINRRRIFPRLTHTQHRRTTTVGNRSRMIYKRRYM